MKLLSTQQLCSVLGGYLGHPGTYAAVGCGLGMTHTYMTHPSPTYRDYGRSCAVGAMHSMNPAFGISRRIGGSNAIGYGVGFVYGKAVNDLGNIMIPSRTSTIEDLRTPDYCPAQQFTRFSEYE